jgi:hypothetical protein
MVLPAVLVCIMLANGVMGRSLDYLRVGRGLMLATWTERLCLREEGKNICVVDGSAYALATNFRGIFDAAYVRADACAAASYGEGCKKCALLEELALVL